MKRRMALQMIAASPLLTSPLAAKAAELIDIDWKDLLPKGNSSVLMDTLRDGIGIVQHGQLSTGFDQEEARAVTDKYNGKTVRLPGFVVPLELDGNGVKDFILVPFVGACLHVPPPPANQLVLVSLDKPFEYQGLYEPIFAVGVINTMAVSTELAEIGYEMKGKRIEPYKF